MALTILKELSDIARECMYKRLVRIFRQMEQYHYLFPVFNLENFLY